MDEDCDFDFLARLDHAGVGLDGEFILSRCFELVCEGCTLKIMGLAVVFLMVRDPGRCFPG